MNLVIVESPAKSRTLKKFLGRDFEIMASYGHIRDLVPKEGSVDPDRDFAMKYALVERSKAQVNKIIAALKKADNLYLATDPDREGEAISWHLCEILKTKKLLTGINVYRIAFHEITKNAVQKAVANPRALSEQLINAQQARRALDYLVGFGLSPLLWRKVPGGSSAGRVQSPALRMIVEREEQIEAFESREYWTIDAVLSKDGATFPASLHAIDDKKVKQFDIADEKHAHEVRDAIRRHAADGVLVSKVEKKERKRNPAPPFTTSTLQQEAVRKLGFSAAKTMRVAQQLYEGIDLGSGSVGLITYMRTDSLTLAAEAVTEIRRHVAAIFGEQRLPKAPRIYKAKTKNAQEAHEAVRPTSAARQPGDIERYLSREQLQLYTLVWKRTVACQMIPATLDTVSVDLRCGNYTLRATGSTVKEPGFMLAYTESKDDAGTARKRSGDNDEKKLPPLKEKELVELQKADAGQHFTEPPPRYSEASLVKALEEYGIGRPSTYASIISTLQNRKYAELVKKRFVPTDTGRVVNSFLTEHFTRYVDYEFTAGLEDELDEISRGERSWTLVMREFWEPFKTLIAEKKENVSRTDVSRILGTDPKSGKPVSVRPGRYGPYAQIGTREDEEKPKVAGLRPGQKRETITLEEALKLFELPRDLGKTHEGEPVQAGIGRFGPFVKYGSKYASIKEDDPHTITLERALEIIAAKEKADAEKIIKVFEAEGIRILKGRWGPYVTNGEKNARVPKDREASSLSLEACQAILAEAPAKGKSRTKAAEKKTSRKRAGKSKSRTKPGVKKTSKKKAGKARPRDRQY